MANFRNTVIDGRLNVPTGTSSQRPTIIFKNVGTTTWTAPTGVTKIQVLVVAGGGGGGAPGGGGGGAGGVVYNSNYTVVPGNTYTVTVGAGGAGGVYTVSPGGTGGNSVFDTITAQGGGGGGGNSIGATGGGSGGGQSGNFTSVAPGTGVAGQGNAGGTGQNGTSNNNGGGGGAGAAGGAAVGATNVSGNGGQGVLYAITGIPTWYGGGGGAGSQLGTPGTGGAGGGGNGSQGTNAATAGTSNTGGGGGGTGAGSGAGAAGGSGIVIISYNQEIVEIFSKVGSATWTAPSDVRNVEVLVVAGGGGASGADYATGGGGGGGGGIIYNSSYSVIPGNSYNVTVGAGGAGGTYNSGNNGSNSIFDTLTAVGGGRGAGYPNSTPGNGGSGGGGTWDQNSGGTGTAGQGFAGGNATNGHRTGGGGGGAGQVGGVGTNSQAGHGGNGLPFSITGTTVYYGGGGGGGSADWTDPPTGGRHSGRGGLGGGGWGAEAFSTTGVSYRGGNGAPGTGGGAGGSALNVSSANAQAVVGASGGSGIVILKYRGFANSESNAQGLLRYNSTTSTPEIYTSGSQWYVIANANEIVADALFFHVDAANKNSKVHFPTKLLNDRWSTGSGGFGEFGQNGATAANERIIDQDPWGNKSVVWEARAQATNTAEGGWNSSYVSIDPWNVCRLTVWMRRTVIGTGSSYFGTQNVRNVGDRSNNGNPYFWATGWPYQQNQWYLLVGHCFPDHRPSGATALHAESGIYTVEYGRYRVAQMQADYILRSDAPNINHRTYLYYTTTTDARQQWIRPRIDILDGTEPSLEDLLTDKPVDPYIWYDMSGGRNHLLMYNNPTFNNTNNGSITFDGVNQYAQTNFAPRIHLPAGGTMEMWVYLTAKDRNQGFFSISENPSYINFYMTTANKMRWEVIGNIGSSFATISSTTTFDTGRWYHVAGTFNGTNTSLYINGVLEATQTMTNQPTFMERNIFVGVYSGYCAARIAVARFYTRSLSLEEVNQNFNAQRSRFGI